MEAFKEPLEVKASGHARVDGSDGCFAGVRSICLIVHRGDFLHGVRSALDCIAFLGEGVHLSLRSTPENRWD